ncbi:MAG: choice-of-anchor U domain-containing protein [Dehalococcoidia bacterium]
MRVNDSTKGKIKPAFSLLLLVVLIGLALLPGIAGAVGPGLADTSSRIGSFSISIQTVYVNGATGNDDTYDGSSPVPASGNIGPKQTIAAGIGIVSDNGTVNVAAGTYHEHGLHLSETMNLIGAGALSTIIDANHNGFVIEVSSQPFQQNTISGFTIRNGAPAGSDAGGGIYISQAHIVTINDCAIINNTKGGGSGPLPTYGGGVCNDGGTLYMNRCTVSGNTATASGGGIFTQRTFGGDSGLVELTNCTISGNTVTDSWGTGGGIFCDPDATMHLLNVTIAYNHATGPGSAGGGYSDGSLSSMYFKNCIVANNTAGDSNYNNGYQMLATGVHSEGYNIDSENVEISRYFNQPTDQNGVDPQLGPLQNNGGPTSTHAITASSPAFNRGTCDGAPPTDQRGVARPQGTNCDIGSFELQLIQAPVVASVSPNSGNQGQTVNNVIITGSNFTGATVVSFGSGITTNSFTVNSATQITVNIIIAAGATPGTRDLSVTTPGGTGTLPNGFTVLQPTQSVSTATGTGTATFTTSNGSITGLTAAISTPCGTLSGFSFPQGFFSFNVTDIPTGSTVTITITLPSNMPTGTQYWKCINGAWVNCTSLLGHNDGDNILTLTIKDGGLGDADGQADGKIADPGGPAVPVPVQVPVMPAPRRVSSLKPAQMSVQYLSIDPQQTSANQPVTITTNVVNTGGEAGNLNVALKINGQVEQTKTVSVGPQATQPVKFTVTRAQPGTYTVDIGGQKGSFTILGTGSSTTGTSASDLMIGILIIGALIIATVVALLLIFRRAT